MELFDCDFTELPGSGSKMIAVITGEASVQMYPKNGGKRWDTCAGEPLIRCFGG